MTEVKLESKVEAAVEAGIGPFVEGMFARQDGRWLAVVELKHTRREEPGAGEAKGPAVKLRLTHCEIADAEYEDRFRELLQTMYKVRTAQGTLDDGQVLEHQVIPDQLKWAIDSMLWPPRPGDVWEAGKEPWFAFVADDGETRLMDCMGEVRSYMDLLAEHEEMNLKARKRVERGDDSA